MGKFDKKLNQELARRNRKDDAGQIAAHAAAVKRRKDKTKLYLACAYVVSSVATARGFFLTAQESGAVDFNSMVFAVMQSVVAAVLMAGACAILLDVASELGESD